ncbi:PREDICTED: E3 ubiquitin-protein ligase SPL1-like [Camelina sativa]|uniref:RING-type E3 ubiquitin transferase n=1 Tax=Camelina sativa TaxID=90675 RepID=A0ABM0VNR9_CAMSA|nr:PREDICTED: E3 ubiquitin-protein ligase SPL1-like [Camelina sativa]
MESLLVEVAVFFSCTGVGYYLFGRKIRRRADYLDNITRVRDLNRLDDELLAKNTTSLLVVVSGRVGSAAALNCKNNGLLGVLVKEQAKVDCKIELEDGSLVKTSLNFLLRQEETPWYLEDNTGHQVNVLGVEDAVGFHGIFNRYPFDMPASELFEGVVLPQGTKVLEHNCHGRALNIGTYLTFVGKAVKDKAGNLVIQGPKGRSLRVFKGEGSFESMVDKLKSKSEACMMMGKIFGIYKKELLEELDRRSKKKSKSYSGTTHKREKLDTSPLPVGLACLLVEDC